MPPSEFRRKTGETRLAESGRLASRYTRRFEERWLRGDGSADEELLGSGDIQVLADLGNSMSVVQEMRLFRSAGGM